MSGTALQDNITGSTIAHATCYATKKLTVEYTVVKYVEKIRSFTHGDLYYSAHETSLDKNDFRKHTKQLMHKNALFSIIDHRPIY